MSFEVIESTTTLSNQEQTVATLTAYHPYVSLYLNASGAAAANNSIWRLYAVSDGASVLLQTGRLTSQGVPTALLLGVDTRSALVKLTVQGSNGAANVVSELVGYDPGDVLTPASEYGNGNVMLNYTEQDVCTLGANYPLLNVSVNPNNDPLALGSLWRLYAVFGSTRYLISEQRIADKSTQTLIMPNLLASGTTYVLTAQGVLGVSAVNVTGVVFGSNPPNQSGSGGGGGGGTLLGDAVGAEDSNTVQTISGGNGGNSGYCNLAGYLGIGAFSGLGSTGAIRFGDIRATQPQIYISSTDSEQPGVTLQTLWSLGGGFSDISLGDGNYWLITDVRANLLAGFNINGTTWDVNATTHQLSTLATGELLIGSFVGAFVFDSDANLTSYKWNLNGSTILTLFPTELNIPATTWIGFGTPSNEASFGLLRFGNIETVQTLLMIGKDASAANRYIAYTGGFGDLHFGETNWNSTQIAGAAVSLLTAQSNVNIDAANHFNLQGPTGLISIGPGGVGGGPFFFDSDSTLTKWQFKINTVDIVEINPSQFVTKKGRSRAVTPTAAATYQILLTDDLVVAETGVATINLPSAPSDGDSYTAMNSGVVTGISLAGNGHNIQAAAATGASKTIAQYTSLSVTYSSVVGAWVSSS